MPELQRRLRWLIAIRLLVVASITLPFFLFQQGAVEPGDDGGAVSAGSITRPSADERTRELDRARRTYELEQEQQRDALDRAQREVMQLLVGLASLQTLLYIFLLRVLRRRPTVVAYAQFLGDLLLITVPIYKLAASAVSFSMFYLVVIIVASVLLRRSAGVIVAGLAYTLYAAVMLMLSFDWIPRPTEAGGPLSGLLSPPATERLTGVPLTYNLLVHFFGFQAVAVLTSYLARDAALAEQRLEEKSHDLSALRVVHGDVIQSISSGLATTDLDGILVELNQAGESILGRPASELIGQHVSRSGLFSAETWHDHARAAHDSKLRSEITLRRAGGERTHIGFTLARLRDGEGKHRGFILIFQDLTSWRKLQEQLRIKDRMAAIGEMAAGLAHEVGNPLAAISGSVQMLAGSLPSQAPQRQLLGITVKESQRLDRIVKSFLQFARPGERRVVDLDIASLIADNVRLLRNSDDVHENHEIVADLEPPSARIRADADQISQLYWNLARNALRAMPEGGRLTVVGRLEGERYRLTFRDTGSGMSAEERANLFHPFKSFFDGGSGIGMAIVYRIVEEHGGDIRVESEPGEGAEILVELPVGALAAVEATA